jgi:hypothetical protein
MLQLNDQNTDHAMARRGRSDDWNYQWHIMLVFGAALS